MSELAKISFPAVLSGECEMVVPRFVEKVELCRDGYVLREYSRPSSLGETWTEKIGGNGLHYITMWYDGDKMPELTLAL